MSSKSLLFLFAVILSVSNGAYSAPSQVTVTINDKLLTFNQAPRMYDVLTHVESAEKVYWPAAQLFIRDQNFAETARRELLDKLDQIYQSNDIDSQAFQTLQSHIKGWVIAKSVKVDIDYDAARIIEAANPILNGEDFVLNLGQRPTVYHVTGMVSKQMPIVINASGCFADNLNGVDTLKGASLDEVIIVQPDGKQFRKGIAYWNRDCGHVMPGSQIIFPLAESVLFNDEKSFNSSFQRVVTNRILSQ